MLENSKIENPAHRSFIREGLIQVVNSGLRKGNERTEEVGLTLRPISFLRINSLASNMYGMSYKGRSLVVEGGASSLFCCLSRWKDVTAYVCVCMDVQIYVYGSLLTSFPLERRGRVKGGEGEEGGKERREERGRSKGRRGRGEERREERGRREGRSKGGGGRSEGRRGGGGRGGAKGGRGERREGRAKGGGRGGEGGEAERGEKGGRKGGGEGDK